MQIIGTDSVDISVPLSYSEISLLNVPGVAGHDNTGSPATIFLQSGDRSYQWQGRAERVLGDIGPGTYMPTLLLTVTDPYNLHGTHGDRTPPLAEGLFVRTKLQGKEINDIITIPSKSLRDSEAVWVMNDSGRLSIKKITVLRREHERILVSKGLETGALVITTPVNGAAEGMMLRTK